MNLYPIKLTFHVNSYLFAERLIAERLAPGGGFLAKVFRGGTENALLADLKRDFAKVQHVKPPASRSDSPELYLLATGFRGAGRLAG